MGVRTSQLDSKILDSYILVFICGPHRYISRRKESQTMMWLKMTLVSYGHNNVTLVANNNQNPSLIGCQFSFAVML